jgi:hypothetical protein
MSARGKENVNPVAPIAGRDGKSSELVTQIIGDRYLDTRKMQQYLESKFPGQWKLQVGTTPKVLP